MLDKVVFAAEMTLLEDRFSRQPLTTATKVRYYEYLNGQLSTEEFQQAARVIFDTDRWWPAPARFVEAVHGNARELAAQAWADVQLAIKEGSTNLDFLSPAGRQALRAAGGWQAVYAAPSEIALDRARRAFIDSFELTAKRDGPKALEAPDVLQLETVTYDGH